MRFSVLALLALAACASPSPASTSTPADWAILANALSSEEYAETLLEELESRLGDADADLRGEQSETLYAIFYDSAERQRAIIDRYQGTGTEQVGDAEADFAASTAQTDAAAETVLSPEQILVYRALQERARAALRGQLE